MNHLRYPPPKSSSSGEGLAIASLKVLYAIFLLYADLSFAFTKAEERYEPSTLRRWQIKHSISTF